MKQETEAYRVSHPRAYATGRLAFKGENIERFLIGRQLCVIFLVFFIARLTTSNALWFMRGSGVATFIMEAGLLGALIVAVLAQLAPQIVASKFPVQFMQCRAACLSFSGGDWHRSRHMAHCVRVDPLGWLARPTKHQRGRYLKRRGGARDCI